MVKNLSSQFAKKKKKKRHFIIVTSIFCTMLIHLFNPGKWRSKQFGAVLVQVN